GDFTAVLGLLARDLGLSPARGCTVGIAAEDERAVVVVRGSDGKDRGVYDDQPSRAASTLVPQQLAQHLAGCAQGGIMTSAALKGQPRALPADLPWSYITGRRHRAASTSTPASAPHSLIVTDVAPPPYLELPTLSAQLPVNAAATTLSGA